MSLDEVINFAGQICKALSYAHKSIVHRDIKPENIIVVDPNAKYPIIKIMDFGIAKTESPSLHQSQSAYMGTPIYMAPEQYTDASGADKRADIYSVGVVLYELMTFSHPLGTFSMPTEINPALPEAVDNVIKRCLNPDRNKRFNDASEIVFGLEKAVRGEESVLGVRKVRVAPAMNYQGAGGEISPKLMVQSSHKELEHKENPEGLSVSGNKDVEETRKRKGIKPILVLVFVLVLAAGVFLIYSNKSQKSSTVNRQSSFKLAQDQVKKLSVKSKTVVEKEQLGSVERPTETKNIDNKDSVSSEQKTTKSPHQVMNNQESKNVANFEKKQVANKEKHTKINRMESDNISKIQKVNQINQFLNEGINYFKEGKYELCIVKMQEVFMYDKNNKEARQYIVASQNRLNDIKREFINPQVGGSR